MSPHNMPVCHKGTGEIAGTRRTLCPSRVLLKAGDKYPP